VRAWVVNSSWQWDDERFEWIDVEVEGLAGWRIRVVPALTGGGATEIVGLTISPAGSDVPPGGVTAGVLRALHVRDLHLAARAAAVQHRRFGDAPGLDSWTAARRPGRAGRADAFYAAAAAEYIELLDTSPAPVRELADRHHLSASQIRGILHGARRRGLLTEAPAGRPGGTLTAKARRILGEQK
jgi:hypothetical protein